MFFGLPLELVGFKNRYRHDEAKRRDSPDERKPEDQPATTLINLLRFNDFNDYALC
jgi:hypothetical protein